MSRILTAAAALSLSLAATAALAHGGSHGGFDGGPQPGNVTFTLQPNQGGAGVGAGKVVTTTETLSGHDRREFAERQQRVQEEIKRLQEEKTRLIRELGPLDQFRSVEALERAKRDILQIDERIGRLQGEESGGKVGTPVSLLP